MRLMEPWTEKRIYNEDPLHFYYEKRFAKSKLHRWIYKKWEGAENEKMRLYKSIIDTVNHYSTEELKKLPVYYSNTWAYYFVLLCQHYSTLRQSKRKEYQWAVGKFQDWIRSSGFIWQYDVGHMYDGFSHAILLMEHHHILDEDIIPQWKWVRWMLLLSGKPDPVAVAKIPEEWWHVGPYPSVPMWNAPLMDNKIIRNALEEWLVLLLKRQNEEICFSILKGLLSPYFSTQTDSMRLKHEEMFQWFKHMVRTHGSGYCGEWELYNLQDWHTLRFKEKDDNVETLEEKELWW